MNLITFLVAIFFLVGCVTPSLRYPSSPEDVFTNATPEAQLIRQNLRLLAQNNILLSFPDETLFESEKSEIDSKCATRGKPFWSERLSNFLKLVSAHPEWLEKFHVIEIKKGDIARAIIEKDLDGAAVLSLQYVKIESRNAVHFKSTLPCGGNIAEYLGKDVVQTQYKFPEAAQIENTLTLAGDKMSVPRFSFDNGFTMYLADRGFILKFDHELSFEKTTRHSFVYAEVLNELSREIKAVVGAGAKELVAVQHKHLNLWMKLFNESKKSDDHVQIFSLENHRDLKSGIKFKTNDQKRETVPLLYISYSATPEKLLMRNLDDLDRCLSRISVYKTLQFVRKPTSDSIASEEDPARGHSCEDAVHAPN